MKCSVCLVQYLLFRPFHSSLCRPSSSVYLFSPSYSGFFIKLFLFSHSCSVSIVQSVMFRLSYSVCPVQNIIFFCRFKVCPTDSSLITVVYSIAHCHVQTVLFRLLQYCSVCCPLVYQRPVKYSIPYSVSPSN